MAIFKELIGWTPDNKMKPTHEEIPQEELWEDGELSNVEVQQKIINRVMQQGDWILIRKLEAANEEWR